MVGWYQFLLTFQNNFDKMFFLTLLIGVNDTFSFPLRILNHWILSFHILLLVLLNVFVFCWIVWWYISLELMTQCSVFIWNIISSPNFPHYLLMNFGLSSKSSSKSGMSIYDAGAHLWGIHPVLSKEGMSLISPIAMKMLKRFEITSNALFQKSYPMHFP